MEERSGCPINLTLEVVGDKWSLLIIRDMMFGNRRHFRELLTKSEEGISSNILADRLKTLLEQDIITRGRPQPQAEGNLFADGTGHRTAAGSRADVGLGLQVSSRQRGTRHSRPPPERGRTENVGRVHGRIAPESSQRSQAETGTLGGRAVACRV
jgi:hypothetical protein